MTSYRSGTEKYAQILTPAESNEISLKTLWAYTDFVSGRIQISAVSYRISRKSKRTLLWFFTC